CQVAVFSLACRLIHAEQPVSRGCAKHLRKQLIINRGAAHPYKNQAGWAIDMGEYIDYQVYEKRPLLTLSADFNREDGIYQGVGISEGAGRAG
ncbi:MAG: hypothetical protein PUK70_06865, partial [Bacteroidales bacterium]|nr:hypothetical protein [Bacteroidales bacterium]